MRLPLWQRLAFDVTVTQKGAQFDLRLRRWATPFVAALVAPAWWWRPVFFVRGVWLFWVRGAPW